MAVGGLELASSERAAAAGKYNGRVTTFVVLSCMMAAMGGILFGYDIGISGGVTSMEPFLKRFFPEVYTRMKEDKKISNYCKFDSQLLTLFTSSLYIAGLVASFFASSVTRAFGRKPSILIGGVAFLFGTTLGAAAINIYMLIFGRLFLGVGVGFANQRFRQEGNVHFLELADAKASFILRTTKNRLFNERIPSLTAFRRESMHSFAMRTPSKICLSLMKADC